MRPIKGKLHILRNKGIYVKASLYTVPASSFSVSTAGVWMKHNERTDTWQCYDDDTHTQTQTQIQMNF